ncbi:MAG: glutamine--tRNA ligase [Sutterellaceae bacterium]|nr:glutamine--tRNA ligase [Burkholderiaceae bacterium]MCX7901705.1 glutamine--tRNA ligase [Burkholderiaceae bacterium]MDW8429022.1 glutamine--tRNA ligase [Sutterellaceae bacterium]
MEARRGDAADANQGSSSKGHDAARPPLNFLRNVIAADLLRGTYEDRNWAGRPGPYDIHAHAPKDPARIRTRFPPEPNGYLHIGHAKSICLNFGLARDFGGRCHMRFDDTNPVKEDQEYVDGILDAVRWLGFDWEHVTPQGIERNLYHASDYFEEMYRCAEYLIQTGYAYVDEQSAEQIRATRGTLTEPGMNSPYRDRPIEDSLRLFREMRAGKHAEGSMVLRAKIDMASPNINMRDPVIYRIRFATHHRTGDRWCIYPMYAYAHPIEDALENITHSICTLEFEDQRPFYDWTLERLVPLLRRPQYEAARRLLAAIAEQGAESKRQFALHCRNFLDKLGHTRYERRAEAMFASWSKNPDLAANDADEFFKLLLQHTECFTPLLQAALDERKPNPFLLPHQYEFNRLNLTYVVMSKRRLAQLVEDGHVDGWDDPRMPTLVGLRRRGYTPQSIQRFVEQIGVSKSPQWIDYAVLEQALRDDLEARAPRATAVLRPLKLVIDNYPPGQHEDCRVPNHPQNPHMGTRTIPFARELWIEADDFMENPPPDYFRLSPGALVRLRYAYVVRATAVEKDAAGRIVAVHAEYLPETKSGTPGASRVKTRAAIHWLPVHAAVPAEVRLYDRLFVDPQPDAGDKDFLSLLNPHSRTVLQAFIEPALAAAQPDDKFQFERNGYFVADRKDHHPGRPVFNLAVTLKESWSR